MKALLLVVTLRTFNQAKQNSASFHSGYFVGLFLALKMEANCSSETSVDSQQTTRRYVPEDATLLVFSLF
jgi:hypothetical protein